MNTYIVKIGKMVRRVLASSYTMALADTSDEFRENHGAVEQGRLHTDFEVELDDGSRTTAHVNLIRRDD